MSLPLHKHLNQKKLEPKPKCMTAKAFHSRDASQMLNKCLIECKIEEAIKWSVELHVSGHLRLCLDTLEDFIITNAGSVDIYEQYQLRRNRLLKTNTKSKDINRSVCRFLLAEMVGICYHFLSIPTNKEWNTLALPKVSYKDFEPLAPKSLDFIKEIAKTQNTDYTKFPIQMQKALNDIFWTASNYSNTLKEMDKIAWASQMYAGYLACSYVAKKKKINAKLWLPWIWYGLTLDGPMRLKPWIHMKKWAKFKQTNQKWNAICLIRGWFMNMNMNNDDVDVSMRLQHDYYSTKHRMNLVIDSFKYYDAYKYDNKTDVED